MRRYGALALGLAVAAVACGGDSLSVSNTAPLGSVGGVVVNAETRAPLAGATVTLVAGGTVKPAVTTAADGTFAIPAVPAGGVIAIITGPTGFWGATVRGEVPGQAGEFPTGNQVLTLGPIGLVPADGTLSIRVLSDQGRPVATYDVSVQTTFEWIDLSWDWTDAAGEVILHATTDTDGYATFTGMPDYFALGSTVNDALYVELPPWDANSDGIWDYAGGEQVLFMRSLNDPTLDVVLDPNYQTELWVVASTIGGLEYGYGPSAVPYVLTGNQIDVKFNLPIDGSADVVITDEEGVPMNPDPTWTVRDDNLNILMPTPAQGAEYNLVIHATTIVGDRIISADFAAPFFTKNNSDAVAITATRDTGRGVFVLKFSEPVGVGYGIASLGGWDGCVVYLNLDMDLYGGVGNYPGEVGSPACGFTLSLAETDPPGPAGLSGYGTTWEMPIPTVFNGTSWVPIEASRPMWLMFSGVANPLYRLKRADGRVVGDRVEATAILTP